MVASTMHPSITQRTTTPALTNRRDRATAEEGSRSDFSGLKGGDGDVAIRACAKKTASRGWNDGGWQPMRVRVARSLRLTILNARAWFLEREAPDTRSLISS